MREVSGQQLVTKLSELLKKNENIKPPEWSRFVKTGASTYRPPTQPDWWYRRSAAVLRRIYNTGPVGVQRLRTAFGGRKQRGYHPPKHYRAGGKIIRLILQQLEAASYLKKVETPKGGRIVTSLGQKIISKAAREAR